MTTNSLPFAIAPDISTWAPGVPASGSINVTVPCTPFLRPGQEVSADYRQPAGGGRSLHRTRPMLPHLPIPILQPTGGAVPARMRVDGIDSAIINLTATPPTYSGPLVTVT